MINYNFSVISKKAKSHLANLIRQAQLKTKKQDIADYSFKAGWIACLRHLDQEFKIKVTVERDE